MGHQQDVKEQKRIGLTEETRNILKEKTRCNLSKIGILDKEICLILLLEVPTLKKLIFFAFKSVSLAVKTSTKGTCLTKVMFYGSLTTTT